MIKMIFVLGELGGRDEYSLVEALKQGKISKPVVAWVSGTCARLFKSEVQFGHAGAKSGGEMESAQAKNQALHDAGAVVPTSFEAFETVIKETFEKLLRGAMLLLQRKFKPPQIPEDLNTVIKSGKVRAPTHIISTISDDRGEEPCYAGIPMSSIVEQGYGVGDVISLLWFKRSLPRYCTRFIEICVMLCADHGPCVSGAHNTIVTARAGKDLVSSLVSGLLTIGPRFGGAIDDAARYFKDAYDKRINSITVTRNMLSHERKAPQPLGVLKPWALLVDEYLKRVVDESIDLWVNNNRVIQRRMQDDSVEFDADGKAVGVTSEGETAKCKKVVCDPSYLPDKVQKVGKVARAVCIMSHPIPDTKDSHSVQVILPQKQLGRKSEGTLNKGKMSATVKDMVMRLTSHVAAKRVVLLKHKYVDHTQIDFLRGNNYRKASVHLNRSCSRVQLARCQEVLQFSANGFTNLKPEKGKRQLGSWSRSQAILTPVLDPTPTMKKLFYTLLDIPKTQMELLNSRLVILKFGTAIDGVIKIFTVAVTIVVVAVPEGLPLAATLTWFFNIVGDSRCPISDTWWQTETGGFMYSHQAKVFDSKSGAELLDIILKKACRQVKITTLMLRHDF
ncbi:unnamed protein product [Camellia sinensis]